jgi:hypothetical protein
LGCAGTGQGHTRRVADNSRGQPGSGRTETGFGDGLPVQGHDRPAADPNSGRAGTGQGHTRRIADNSRGQPESGSGRTETGLTGDRPVQGRDRPAAEPHSSGAETGQGQDRQVSDNNPGRFGTGRGPAETGFGDRLPVQGHDRPAADPNSGRAETGHDGPVFNDRQDRLITDSACGSPVTGPDRGWWEGTGLPKSGEAGRLPEMFFQKVPGCHYPLGVILLSLQWVREGTSLRGVSRQWERWMVVLGLPWWGPHPTTIRLWVLRYGHWELTRPKEQADDWLWVIDHSAQFGVLKCLLILGIRRSQIPSRPLGLADMALLDLQPVARSNGTIVEQQLGEQAEATGVPLAILRDEGSDLCAGTRQFEAKHPQTAVVYDVKHHTARVLKRHLEADAQWGEYTTACSQWRPQIQQTLWAFLAPPSGRAHKARWMNVGELIGWGVETLQIVHRPPPPVLRWVDQASLQDKLGWLESYAPALVRWRALEALTRHTLDVVRREGFHAGTVEAWEAGLVGLPTAANMGPVQAELKTYLQGESAKAGAGRLPGTTEVIESSFAKLKAAEQQQSRSGLTGMVLALGSLLRVATAETIRQAFASTPVSAVRRWCTERIGSSVQAQRRAAYQAVRKRNENGANPDP